MCSNTPASQSGEAVRRGQRSNGAKNTRGRSLGCPACQNLAAFHQRCGERKSNHFLRRHVRLRKYRSACKRARWPPEADSACAAVRPQTTCQKVILFDSHDTRGRSLGCRDIPSSDGHGQRVCNFLHDGLRLILLADAKDLRSQFQSAIQHIPLPLSSDFRRRPTQQTTPDGWYCRLQEYFIDKNADLQRTNIAGCNKMIEFVVNFVTNRYEAAALLVQ